MSCRSPFKMHDIPSVQAIEFRQAMRNLASGVAIVTTGAAVRRRGLTVSSVTSICMEPPCLLVAINASSETHDAIFANNSFGVSFLCSDQEDLALRFGGGMARKEFTVSFRRSGIRVFSTYRFCKARCLRSSASCMTIRGLARIPSLSDELSRPGQARAIR